MEISVELPSGTTGILEVESSDLVGELKQQLSDLTGLPSSAQQLAFAGQVLVDGRTLADYNIQKESTVHLTVAGGIVLEPGASTTSSVSLSWSAPALDPGQSFSVAWSASDDPAVSGSATTTGSAFTIPGLQAGTDYEIEVFVTGYPALSSGPMSIATAAVSSPSAPPATGMPTAPDPLADTGVAVPSLLPFLLVLVGLVAVIGTALQRRRLQR